ncbi:MAG TPA: exosortase-associated EpsI family protein [Kiritimatiellia bacterium]
METRTLKPYFVLIGLLAATSVALAYSVDVTLTDQAGIKVLLPDNIGPWTGREMRFCINPLCRKAFTVDELSQRNICKICGGQLDSMTLDEKSLLPADTVLLRKMYKDAGHRTIFATIVLSGSERASIHRPQICLEGQGNAIVGDTVVPVPIAGRDPLDIMVLDVMENRRLADGTHASAASYFAYWFVGKDRETPYHMQRMFWMASDRIFRNVSHRWAYISVSGARQEDSDAYRDEIKGFVSELFPQMVLAE